MTRFEVDTACGQTPCLCGDIETWHPQCYAMLAGVTENDAKKIIAYSYKVARRKLREASIQLMRSALNRASDK